MPVVVCKSCRRDGGFTSSRQWRSGFSPFYFASNFIRCWINWFVGRRRKKPIRLNRLTVRDPSTIVVIPFTVNKHLVWTEESKKKDINARTPRALCARPRALGAGVTHGNPIIDAVFRNDIGGFRRRRRESVAPANGDKRLSRPCKNARRPAVTPGFSRYT